MRLCRQSPLNKSRCASRGLKSTRDILLHSAGVPGFPSPLRAACGSICQGSKNNGLFAKALDFCPPPRNGTCWSINTSIPVARPSLGSSSVQTSAVRRRSSPRLVNFKRPRRPPEDATAYNITLRISPSHLDTLPATLHDNGHLRTAAAEAPTALT